MSEQTVSTSPRGRRQGDTRGRARSPLRRIFEWLLVLLTLAILLVWRKDKV